MSCVELSCCGPEPIQSAGSFEQVDSNHTAWCHPDVTEGPDHVMVPLAEPADAPDAPPLVITVGEQRARVHLLTTAPVDELGTSDGELTPEEPTSLRDANYWIPVVPAGPRPLAGLWKEGLQRRPQ